MGPSPGSWRRCEGPRAALSLIAVTTGCAAQGAYLNEGPTALGKPPYQVGPVTVVIRPPAEVAFEGPWHK